MEAVAADAPVLAPAPRAPRTSDASVGHRRVERRVEDGDVRHVRAARAAPASIAASAGALCSGASSTSASSSALTVVVDHDRLARSAARRGRRGARPRRRRRRLARATSTGRDDVVARRRRESLRLVEPALTTRIRLTPDGQAQSRIAGSSSPCSRVYARARSRASTISCRRCAALVREPGHAVDHVDHEVEAVEVVQHHHVERRRRRALLLVAAHVQVVVVRRAGR